MFSLKELILIDEKGKELKIESDITGGQELTSITISKTKFKFSKIERKVLIKSLNNFSKIEDSILELDEIESMKLIDKETGMVLLDSKDENFSIFTVENEIHISYIK